MALSATVSSRRDRDERLWSEELARVRARRYTLKPVAAAAVQSALRSILSERAEDDSLGVSTLAALEEVQELRATTRRKGKWRTQAATAAHPKEVRIRALRGRRCLSSRSSGDC
ncbi:MAG TPA: hypothetical protein VGK68_03210 [Gaiellaceae bacterium]